MAKEEGTSWHLDKKVPITLIVVVVLQFSSGLWFLAQMKQDIEVLKVQQVDQRARDHGQDEELRRAVDMLRSDIRLIGEKMDRVLEQRANPERR